MHKCIQHTVSCTHFFTQSVVGYAGDDVYMHTAPLFHVGGLSSSLATLTAGALQVVLPRFDAQVCCVVLGLLLLLCLFVVVSACLVLVSACLALVSACLVLVAIVYCSTRAYTAHVHTQHKRHTTPTTHTPSLSPQQQTIQAIHHHAATSFIAVPTMLTDLHAACTTPLSTVRRVLIGGGTPSPEQLGQVQQCAPNAEVYVAYGMSEAASSITFDHVVDHGVDHALPISCRASHAAASGGVSGVDGQRTGGVGQPVLTTMAHGQRVGRPPTGIAVRLSDIGEILTRGPHVMLGYWGDAGATAQAVDDDGWLHTGVFGWVWVWGGTCFIPLIHTV